MRGGKRLFVQVGVTEAVRLDACGPILSTDDALRRGGADGTDVAPGLTADVSRPRPRPLRRAHGVGGVDLRQGGKKGLGGDGQGEAGAGESGVRIIDLHCYPGTEEWIACQGAYVEALTKY